MTDEERIQAFRKGVSEWDQLLTDDPDLKWLDLEDDKARRAVLKRLDELEEEVEMQALTIERYKQDLLTASQSVAGISTHERIEASRQLVAEHGCGLNPENAQAVLDRLGELEAALKDAMLCALSCDVSKTQIAENIAASLRTKGEPA